MFRIIGFNNRPEWDTIVKSFNNYDIYYLSGYLHAFKIHGDGEPILVYYEDSSIKGICAYMLRDISAEKRIKDIPPKCYYDVVTPYGYGGFIFDGKVTSQRISSFFSEYKKFMKNNGIICAFTRWHPLLQNQNILRGLSNVIDLGKTIHIETTDENLIMKNMESKDRCTIRKAVKNGITIEHSKDPKLFDKFIEIYNQTMDKDHAAVYYYFQKEFYESIIKNIYDNFEMFYAVLDGNIIAMSIILFCNGLMHYHLSGSIFEYRRLNATNLLLYEAAVYGAKNGYTKFHLGGGVGSGEDPLYKFKRSFNKYSNNQFSISKDIFDNEIYNEIVENRKSNDPDFNENSAFFPLYRS